MFQVLTDALMIWRARVMRWRRRLHLAPRRSPQLDALGYWLVSWSRLLNAFPDIEPVLAFAEATKTRQEQLNGKWVQIVGSPGYMLATGQGGRFSPTLPPNVRIEEVIQLTIDRSGTPGKDSLRAYAANVRIALDAGWETPAERVLDLAQRVVETEFTKAVYEMRLRDSLYSGLKAIALEDWARLPLPAQLARAGRLRKLIDDVANEALAAYGVYHLDGLSCAEVLIFREVSAALQDAETDVALGAAALLDSVPDCVLRALPDDNGAAMTTSSLAIAAVAGALKRRREGALERALEALHEQGEKLIGEALAIPQPEHEVFHDLLYAAVPALRACHQLGRYVDALQEQIPDVASASFLRRFARTRHVVEEQVIRIQECFTQDAEDILGLALARRRKSVMEIHATEGAGASAIAALEFTTHGLLYPRVLEPYLRGEVDRVNWKATW